MDTLGFDSISLDTLGFDSISLDTLGLDILPLDNGHPRDRQPLFSADLLYISSCKEVDHPCQDLLPVLQVPVEDAGDLLFEVHQAGELVDRIPRLWHMF